MSYKKTYVRYFCQVDRKTGKPVVDANGNPLYDPKNDFDRECYLTEEDVERLYGTHVDENGKEVQSKMTPDKKDLRVKGKSERESRRANGAIDFGNY